MPLYKIASADIINTPLLKHVAKAGKPMILSTGGATLEDVKRGYHTVAEINPQVALLQCTAGYPAAWEELDLRVISSYRDLFPDSVVGLSSHDNGIAMAVAAYVLGGRIVEKHFTLNRALKGTDHRFSLEPQGLRKLVRDLKRTRVALGDGNKSMYPSETEPIIKMAKKLVAARDLPAGHTLTEADIAFKSPGDGLPPYELDRVLGRTLTHPVHGGRRADLRGARGPASKSAPRRVVTDLTGQVAVVTGLSGRLGPVWATALRDAGATVVGIDLASRRRRLRRGRDRPRRHGGRARADHRRPRRPVDPRQQRRDRPAAGRGRGRATAIEDVPLEAFTTHVDVNLAGTFNAIQVFGPAMVAAGAARSSTSARCTRRSPPSRAFYDHLPGDPPFLKPAAYGASKAAVLNLTRYFARLWGPHGVRVNAISPGGVEGGQDEQFLAKYTARVPLGRMAQEADLGGPLVFLASDASRYVTGHTPASRRRVHGMSAGPTTTRPSAT